MQTIYLDISNKGVVPTVYAKQKEVGRKFAVILTDSGLPYIPEVGSVFSVWYKGASGEGNYTDIGDKPAFSLSGNKVEVEMIVQMLFNHGDGTLCLTLNSPNGNQISSWNIPYMCEIVPGSESEKAEEYYTAFSKAVEELPYPDASLSVHGKAADAAAVGTALSEKAPAGYGLGDFSGAPCSDCNAAVQVGFYGMVGSGAINTPSEIYAFKWGSLIVDATISTVFQTIKSAYATAHRAGTKSGSTVTWGEWEYSISPMDVGVEYRTTERWNGKPVYTMMANIGALPNNTGKTTEDGPLPMGITPISAYGIGLNGKTGAVIPSRHIYLSVYGEWGTVYINTDSDYSNYTGYITVKYVKD